jgi:hypothetical protein
VERGLTTESLEGIHYWSLAEDGSRSVEVSPILFTYIQRKIIATGDAHILHGPVLYCGGYPRKKLGEQARRKFLVPRLEKKREEARVQRQRQEEEEEEARRQRMFMLIVIIVLAVFLGVWRFAVSG